jgi:hypothetical protein
MKCLCRTIFLLGFFHLAFGVFLSSSPVYSSPCNEILKHPTVRDDHLFKKEVFGLGDELLEKHFGHNEFALLDKTQKEIFVFEHKKRITENLSLQGTVIEPIGKTTAFVVRGGISRLGRIATGLRKLGVTVIVDSEVILKINAAAFYSPKRRMIILGLEDALYPNQISFNLLHEVMHASNDSKALLIPRIYDDFVGGSYEDFSLDEIIVYSKQIMHMINKGVVTQNSEAVGKGRVDKLSSAFQILKELSQRTLSKKDELIKVLDYLREVEKNPSILNARHHRFIVEGLDPQIFLMRSGFFEYLPSQVTEELIQSDPSIQYKIFQGDIFSYWLALREKARFSRKLIEKALFFAENAEIKVHTK